MNSFKMFLISIVTMVTVMMGSAHAAIDLTSVTAGFTDLEAAITTVGGLILSAAVIAVAFKWVKGMIFS